MENESSKTYTKVQNKLDGVGEGVGCVRDFHFFVLSRVTAVNRGQTDLIARHLRNELVLSSRINWPLYQLAWGLKGGF